MDPVTRSRTALRELGREPAVTASAPSRVNLLGGHTDYNDGFVLPVAIDRRCAVALAPRDDTDLRVHSVAHDSLREDYEVSCAEVEAVVDLARAHPDVLGARLTGGGFGGCVVCLVRPNGVEPFREAIEEGYPERTARAPSVFICETAGGARLE